jgi:16S rRNA processing protein RimM
VVELEGLGSPEEARALTGWGILAERSSLPKTADDEIYQHDLLGLLVLGPDGGFLGRVAGTMGQPEALMLSIGLQDGSRAYLPFQDGYVLGLDLKAGTLVSALGHHQLRILGFLDEGW